MPELRNLQDIGLTPRQVHHWIAKGWLTPLNPNPGTGNIMQWSYNELRVAAVMYRLTQAGFGPDAAHTVARVAVHAGGAVELAPGIKVEVTQP